MDAAYRALGVRVAALEERYEKAGNKMKALDKLDVRFAVLEERYEEAGNKMEALDKIVATLEGHDKEVGNKTEAYVEKVGEETHMRMRRRGRKRERVLKGQTTSWMTT